VIVSGNGATSAMGGSATSQADSLERHLWEPRPWVSFSLRVAIMLIPLVAGVIAVKLTARLISRPSEPLLFAMWLAALVIVSLVAATATQRATRRLAPLGALFKMTLVFPDEAPSRFRTALPAGSTRSLALRHERSSAATSPEQIAVEDLFALMARLNRHDRVTRGHSEQVRAYSVMLGEEIGLSRDDLDKFNWATTSYPTQLTITV
jgi:hypothetical protein